MNLLTMRYKGFTFPVNPEDITFHLSKHISAASSLSGRIRVNETGSEPSVVSGSGCFFGDDAQEQAYRLMMTFRSKGAAWLYAPALPPMRMYFCSLKISRNAQRQCTEYHFTFVEDTPLKKHTRLCRYVYVRANETLFDVANRTGVPVEELAERNRVKDLFSLKEGDRIWLN